MSIQGGPFSIHDSGLALHLDAANPKSYIGSGTTWNDLSNNNITGTLVGGPTFNSSNGGSIVFDGLDDRMTLTNTNFGITNRFTIEVVCKPTAIQQNGMFNFLGSVGDRGIMCHWPWSDGNCYFDIYDTNGTFYRWYKGMSSIVNSINMFHIYVDSSGIQTVKQNCIIQTPTAYGQLGAYNVSLGVSNTIGDFYAAGGSRWPGNMYLFKVYNRTLSDAEMLQNYNATRTRFGL
jgi:hypothetical protein